MPDDPAPSHWRWTHTLFVVALTALFVVAALLARWGLFTSWVITMLSLTLFTLVVGNGVTGVWKGAFVDERNRMSLSRLQMLLWTVVIVSAFGAIAVARLTQQPIRQSDVVGALDIGVPQTIWLLVGISTASFLGSPLIKNAQKNPDIKLPPEREARLLHDQGKDPATTVVEGQIVKNRSIQDATFADIFMGETVENANHLDVGKMQMFFFTVLLLFAYAFSIGVLLHSTDTPSSLPDVGSGLLPLLGLSHGGYLMSKAAAPTAVEQPAH